MSSSAHSEGLLLSAMAGLQGRVGAAFAEPGTNLHKVADPAYSQFLRSYLTIFFLAAAAFVLVGGTLSLSRLVRPRNPNREKLEAYESGVDPVGSMWSQSQVRYYLFALLFVMFDVEAVFLFPWALRLEDFGTFGLVEMAVFVVILLLGLLYAWKKGVLRWV